MENERTADDVAQHRAEADADRRENSDVRPIARAEARHLVLRTGLNFHGARERRCVRANIERLLQLQLLLLLLLLRQLFLLPLLPHSSLFLLRIHTRAHAQKKMFKTGQQFAFSYPRFDTRPRDRSIHTRQFYFAASRRNNL